MKTMYDRIAARCEEMGIKPSALCDKVGIHRSFMTEIKTGRTKAFSAEKVALISAALNVSCDYLITGKDFVAQVSEDERQLLSAWRRASQEEKENVAFILRNYGVEVPMQKEELVV